MRLRLAVVVAAAFAVIATVTARGDQATGTSGLGAMPDDVRAIYERAQRGIPPSPAEAQRMADWARGLAGDRQQLQKRVDDLRSSQPPASAAARKPRNGGDARIHGSLRIEVHQSTHDDDGREQKQTDTDGVFTVPVIYRFRDVPPSRPDAPAPLVVGFLLDDRAPPPRAPRGGLRTHAVKQRGGDHYEELITGNVQPKDTGVIAGELFADATRPRAYLKIDVALLSRIHVVVDKYEDGKHEHTENDGGGGLPMAQVSMDGVAAPVPFEGAPLVNMPGLRDKLPREIRDAVDKATFDLDAAALKKGLDGGKPFTTTAHFRYRLAKDKSALDAAATITFAIEPPPSELVIAPTDEKAWRKWLPLPWAVSPDDAKIFGVKPHDPSVAVEFMAGYDEQTGGKTCKLDLELRDVSEHRGLTTNYPVDAAVEKGLRILPDQPGLVVDANGQHARTRDKVSSVKFKVAAMETGAWGQVRARCDERAEEAQFAATGKHFVTLPRDDDENHVADQFEEDYEMLHKPPTYDEDSRPQYQRTFGDGYTLYEEYRGFVVRKSGDDDTKTFVRTDPRKKDIFVYDRDGIVHKYYEKNNAAAADLTLHYVDPKLMRYDKGREATNLDTAPPDEHRQMNANTPAELRWDRQFAVVALIDNKLVDRKSGECYDGGVQVYPEPPGDSPLWATIWRHPLKYYSEIRMNVQCQTMHIRGMAQGVGVDAADPAMGGIVESHLMNTVVHEFGHQVGITHHEPRPNVDYAKREGGEPPQAWEWGPAECAMRYARNNLDAALLHKKKWPPNARYCRSRERGRYPLHGDNGKFYEDSEPHTCYEQITLK